MPQSNIFDPARLVLSQPTCPKCWATMCLTHIEPDEPDYDKRTFECVQCEFTTTETVKYR
jgi:hypothetical protein